MPAKTPKAHRSLGDTFRQERPGQAAFRISPRPSPRCRARQRPSMPSSLEGVIAKQKNSIYRSGDSTSWVKVKCPAWREASRIRGEPFGESRFPGSRGPSLHPCCILHAIGIHFA
jgi:hypothetical protein